MSILNILIMYVLNTVKVVKILFFLVFFILTRNKLLGKMINFSENSGKFLRPVNVKVWRFLLDVKIFFQESGVQFCEFCPEMKCGEEGETEVKFVKILLAGNLEWNWNGLEW